MKLKRIEIGLNNTANFSDGINVLPNCDEINNFYNLGAFLATIEQMFKKDNYIQNIDQSYMSDRIVATFESDKNEDFKIKVCFRIDGYPHDIWMHDNEKYLDKIKNSNGNLPILFYLCSASANFHNRTYSKNYQFQDLDDINKRFAFDTYYFNDESQFFFNMALDATCTKKNPYNVFHWNNFKNIVDEFLHVNYYDNFNINLKSQIFVYHIEGYQSNLNECNFEIDKTIGMLMKLYWECLKRKGKDFMQNPCDENGIAVVDYHFGERPSYSDKKWEYYRIFNKYFPNIQFILK